MIRTSSPCIIFVLVSCFLLNKVNVTGTNCSISATQYEALAEIYFKCNGDHWIWDVKEPLYTHWIFPSPLDAPCSLDWQGLECDFYSPGQCDISSIELSTRNMFGTLPPQIGNLSSLTYFNVDTNRLFGTLPASIEKWNMVEVFSVATNNLTGSLPSSLFILTTLELLDLEDNDFTGRVSSLIGNLTNLQTLLLSNVMLSGQLPDDIYSLVRLTNLSVSSTLFTGQLSSLTLLNLGFGLSGPIPSELGQLSQLTYLGISSNTLTGPIPEVLGGLSHLAFLDISYNLLTGDIPNELCAVASLTDFGINNNYLTGRLANCSWPSMLAFYVSSNMLTGSIPSQYAVMSRLEQLDVGLNALTGSIPTLVSKFPDLLVLLLNNNDFTGVVPPSISALKELQQLDFSYNFISGTLPADLSELKILQTLNVYNTLITGKIPTSLQQLRTLDILYLNNNYLTGVLPFSEVGIKNFTQLEYFGVNNNFLSGTIPSTLANLPLLYMEINDNYFSGVNVLCSGISPELNYLAMYTNLFTGTIPSNWTRFVNLRFLLIDYNFINGTLPMGIGMDQIANSTRGPSLIEFSASNNQLVGSIPSELAVHTTLTLLSLSVNCLSGTIPSEFSSLINLVTFNVSINSLGGNLFGMFGPDINDDGDSIFGPFPNMTYLSLFNNSFSSSLPISLFASSSLKVVSISQNCFSGTLPSTICYASGLESLVMNAISSADSCKIYFTSFFSHIFKGTFLNKHLQATIPSCLFSLTALQTLHMAGNGLFGSIPDVAIPASLINLQLGNNALTGTIPSFIQLHPNGFNSLGLQHNKFTGILSSNFVVKNGSLGSNFSTMQLNLNVNRLSGHVPPTFNSLTDINVLAGNLFQCKSNTDLPSNDQASVYYDCGSSEFDAALYVWAGILLFFGLVLLTGVLTVMYLTYNAGTMDMDAYRTSSVRAWYKERIFRYVLNTLQWYQFKYPSGKEKFPNTFQYLTVMFRASKGIAQIAVVYVTVCLCTYLAMKYIRPAANAGAISTVSVQYGWVTTSAFMRGLVPCIMVLLFLFVSLLMVASRIRSKNSQDWSSSKGSDMLSSSVITRDNSTLSSDSLTTPLSPSSSRVTSTNSVSSVLPTGLRTNSISRDSVVQTTASLSLRFIKVLLIHGINIGLTVTVNVLYIMALQFLEVTPMQQTWLTLLLACFKLGWGGLYIPFTMKYLGELSVSRRLCHQVFMYCFLIIIAPLLASAIGSESCFLNVFVANQPITSSFIDTVPAEGCYQSITVYTVDGIARIRLSCTYESAAVTVTQTTVPPFIYSYQCGSTILINYIPVLVYSYLFYALALPFSRLIVLHSSRTWWLQPRQSFRLWVFNAFIRNTVLDCADVVSSLSREVGTSTDQEMQTVVLRSLSVFNQTNKDGDHGTDSNSPNAAFYPSHNSFIAAAAVQVAENTSIGNTSKVNSDHRNQQTSESVVVPSNLESGEGDSSPTSNATVGALSPDSKRNTLAAQRAHPLFDGSSVVAKKLLDFAVMMTFGLAAPVLGLVVALSVIVNTGVWRLMIGKYLTYHAVGNPIAQESLERSSDGLLLGTVSGMWVVTTVACMFWALMVFDMIGDSFGVEVGLIVAMAVCLGAIPALLWVALRLFDVYVDVRPQQIQQHDQRQESLETQVNPLIGQHNTIPKTKMTSSVVDKQDSNINSNFGVL